MIKRTIEISQEPFHVAVQFNQLRLERRCPVDKLAASIPCEDIGVLMVDNCAVTFTLQALTSLSEHGAAVVLCGRNHLPAALLLPFAEHTELVWRLHEQIELSKPARKQLWRQIVTVKIKSQANNLVVGSSERNQLEMLARRVRSGDPENREAQAARIYWSALMEPLAGFRRDPDAPDANALLNYGYAVLRAAVARALVGAGLHPALGLHHHNRANAFCLADDMLEPLRPMVDRCVRGLVLEGCLSVDKNAKTALLGLLASDVRLDGQSSPLLVALQRSVASLAQCYRHPERPLLLIEPIPMEQP